jgi:hypothetical protein
MSTVFSYIVQKRLSQENENVATEALAFILDTSERGRAGFLRLLRSVAPDLPPLRFRTQETKGTARPDMWGFDGGTPRVFIENKFWAGLTENQPLEYLRLLGEFPYPAVLLIVVPETRLETVWRDVKRRTDLPTVSASDRPGSIDVPYVSAVDFRPALNTSPFLAMTSWSKVLRAIEAELRDEPHHRNDLLQLRALCDAANDDASVPLSSAELTNQRTPAFILQLNVITQRAVDAAVSHGVLRTRGLMPMSNWERAGRYISFPQANVGAWFGTDFRRWRELGTTPLWLVFSTGTFGRALEVRTVLEPWGEQHGLACSMQGEDFSVGIDLVPGEEQENVIKWIVARLTDVAAELSKLIPTPAPTQ